MSGNQTTRTTHPSASSRIEGALADRGVRFTFEPNLAVDEVRGGQGIPLRLAGHRTPKAVVERYAEQMKGGAAFPAIVVNDRYELVDGTARWMAAEHSGRSTIAAYVCVDLSPLEARSLAVELNQSHGLPMTKAELRAYVIGAIEEGQVPDVKACSRMTGVSPSTVTRWIAAEHFAKRAAREGLDLDELEGLSDSVRAALNVTKLRTVFLRITALALDARVPAAQLRRIITKANAAPSEAEALAVVAHAREVRSDDVRSVAQGRGRAWPKGARAAPHIGGLLRFEVADLLDVPPERQAETFARLRLLRERLDGTLARAKVEWDLPRSAPRSRDLAEARSR